MSVVPFLDVRCCGAVPYLPVGMCSAVPFQELDVIYGHGGHGPSAPGKGTMASTVGGSIHRHHKHHSRHGGSLNPIASMITTGGSLNPIAGLMTGRGRRVVGARSHRPHHSYIRF